MKIKTIIFVCTLFFISAQKFYSQNNTPNILLIIADDLGIDFTNGYQQNELMPTTPTLDSLRATGITYKNMWSSPSCAPTRAAIISGKYGIKTGLVRAPVNLDVSETSVFTMLNTVTNNAYAKALIGKWHLSNPINFNHPQQHGVDYYEGLTTNAVNNYYNWEKLVNGVASNETEYLTTYFTNSAIQWINTQDKPWFLSLSHIAPHVPFHVPPDGLYSICLLYTSPSPRD